MQILQLKSYFETIGLWKGWDYTPNSAYRTTDLPDLLCAVAQERPNWHHNPDVVKAHRFAQNLLLKAKVSHVKIRELLNWERPLGELIEAMNSLEIEPVLRKALVELRSAKVRAKLELFKQGVLGFTPELAFDHSNRVVNGYLDTIQAMMAGTATSNQTLEVKTVEVGAGYAVPAETDASMGHIIGTGKAWGEMDITGYQTTWITNFMMADNNGAATTIAAVTDTTHFTLTDATGFQVGDRIYVEATGGAVKTTISALSGSDVTSEDAITGMIVTDPVTQIWGEGGLKGNLDGATLFTHSRFSEGGYPKKNNRSILVENAVLERSVAAA